MTMTRFFKYFSLASLTGSAIVYYIPLKSLGFKVDYFLILHLTSMVVFTSMLWSFYKRKKITKNSVNTATSIRKSFYHFVVLIKENLGRVIALTICSILLFVFMQLHIQEFMLSLSINTESTDASGFVELASGHWVIFSAIPTIYYFFVIQLLDNWKKIKYDYRDV